MLLRHYSSKNSKVTRKKWG